MHTSGQMPIEVSVAEVKRRIDGGESVLVIDVREPEEYAIARLEGAELVPLGTIPQNLPRLAATGNGKSMLLLCHHGVRSLNAAIWLRAQGVKDAQSICGGIDAWSQLVDASVPRY